MPELFAFLGTMSWLAAVLLIVGIALMIVEMFIPGFGVPGILGLLFIVAGIVIAAESLAQALFLVLVILVVLSVALFIALRSGNKGLLSRSPLVNRHHESGYEAAATQKDWVGNVGTALTTLRPAGAGEFDGARLDVVSEGEFIQSGASIVITRVEGVRVVVVPWVASELVDDAEAVMESEDCPIPSVEDVESID